MGNKVDLTGQRFGRLVALERINGKWKCQCDCGNIKYISTGNLNNNGTKSCGCLHLEKSKENGLKSKKHNEYKDNGDFIIGKTSNDYEFYIDKDNYELIQPYCWHKHQDGYLRTCYDYYIDDNGKRHNKYILMHTLIMFGLDKNVDNLEVDHINGMPNDNRKDNLRLVTHSQNMKNMKFNSSNTSGHKGVHYSKREKKYKAYIAVNGKTVHLGTFEDYDSAVKARENAEINYYKSFKRNDEDLENGTR